jgi:hypothetical protein
LNEAVAKLSLPSEPTSNDFPPEIPKEEAIEYSLSFEESYNELCKRIIWN